MKLPGAEAAVVEPEKVRDYLLSPTHQVGRFKAVFFAALGYTGEEGVQGKFSRFGNKYEISGMLTGPSGRSARVLTVWLVRHDENFPRFVTAMPGDKR